MHACVQPPLVERPFAHGGGGCTQFTPTIVPSQVECQGRSTCVSFSEYNGDAIVGIDVAPVQRWRESAASFLGYAAGAASDGSALAYQNKKVVAVRESAAFGVWLSGSNNQGAISRRAIGASVWQLITTGFYGEVQDGGSTNPRRTGARLVAIDGANVFVACERSSAPTNGIARSLDSGASYTAWGFATSRNYTALMRSPQYDCLYATSDDRSPAASSGVWIVTGLTGTASFLQIDTIGSGAPTLSDVRDVYVVQEGTTDTLFVVVGNIAGSDADRGIWRCRINADPTGGGFSAANITWTHILTPGASDRVNKVIAFKPNGPSAGPIYVRAVYHSSATNSSGSYTLSAGAGGTSENYRVVSQFTLDGDAATPTWVVDSASGNVNTITYATQHHHVITYVGEKSNEKGRWGGSGYSCTDLAVSADGARVVASGKSTPWVCDNPWAATPIWRPFSKGLGALEGGYQNVAVPGSHKNAVADDDRGLYTFRNDACGYDGPAWVIAENIDGVIGTNNSMNGVSLDPTDATGNTLLCSRDLDGKGYNGTNMFDFATAAITAILSAGGTGKCIGAYRWVDSGSVTRTLVVTSTGFWRDTTQVSSVTSAATRSEFISSGAVCWLYLPDLGIYRSTNDGATWVLWWDLPIGVTQTAKYSGHMAQDRDVATTLWITYTDGGVWKAISANSTAVGSGVAGSRPANTTKVTGGALPLGTEATSALAVDATRGDVWVCGYSPTGATTPKLYRLPHEDQTAWQTVSDPGGQYAESALIPQTMTVIDGLCRIGTASNGTLRRLA